MIEIKENKVTAKLKHIITICDCTSEKAKKMSRLISEGASELIEEYHKLFTVKVHEFTNKVPDVYLEAIAENEVTAPGSLPATSELRTTYIAVGTGTATPVAGDTQLETEVFRNNVNSQIRNGKISQSTLFITNSEGNGSTLSEVGAFCGAASAAADSGTLASHALLSPTVVKTNAKTVTIQINKTYSDA